VQQYYLGGGFGRRLEVDHAAQAAQIALALPGVPVQLIWSREEDMRHDFYRPSALVRLQAGLDKEGNLAAWQVMSTGSAIVPAYMPRAVGMPLLGPDKTTAEGLFDTAYGIAHTQVSHTVVDSPVPVGFWRSVGHSHNAFIKESFMDECAHAAGKDPLAYRMHLLQDRPRERAVLQLVADKAGWGKTLPPGRAQGIALHESFGSVVAQVVEASISEGRIKVHQVFTAIDCGLAVNPAGIRQQVEGSVVFALTAALYGRIDIDEGSVRQSNFHDYPLLRLSEMPVVDTFIVPSEQAPEGVGEPAVPPVAPALANALFRLHGQRQRQLPLRASI
jgi:isoquinoline 1-oxidoreductase beta subunit